MNAADLAKDASPQQLDSDSDDDDSDDSDSDWFAEEMETGPTNLDAGDDESSEEKTNPVLTWMVGIFAVAGVGGAAYAKKKHDDEKKKEEKEGG